MSDYLQRIAAASTWQDYYDAHKAVYTTILQEHWAFGTPGFAQQLHHTAIPDVSGSVAGAVNWAVYSQPSAETLESFLGVFAELLHSEPHRIRNSRYLFFVTAGPAVPREKADNILGPLAARVDYWCGSFDEFFSADKLWRAALGLEALYGARNWLIKNESCQWNPYDELTLTTLKAVRDAAHKETASSNSVVPLLIRGAFVDSSIILIGVKAGSSPESLADLIGEGAGVAAYIARDRARISLWQEGLVNIWQELLTLRPPRVEEYVVQPGDILSRIIRERYEMPYERLWPLIRALNSNLRNPDRIFVGQRLLLPVLVIPGSAPRPKSR